MTIAIPPWRSFRTLASNEETTSASACCRYSFETLEVACCHPGVANFALTERRLPNVWRWAVCSTDGFVLRGGSEPTQSGARKVAEAALQIDEA